MFRDMKYFDVYVLCQVANRLFSGEFAKNVNDFMEPFSESYEGQNKFHKYSLLHDYCEWVIRENIWDEEEDIIESIRDAYRLKGFMHPEGILWIDQALNYYFGKNYVFLCWIDNNSDKNIDQLTDTEIEDLRYDYIHYLQEENIFDGFIIQLSNEMFYVLFQNRTFLYNFNQHLAAYNQEIKERIAIPQWVQRAVFFRDHGCCVFCGKDLSGTMHVTEGREIHYDHMISLDSHGINDISNLQLSCQQCNLKKSAGSATSICYQQWYELDIE